MYLCFDTIRSRLKLSRLSCISTEIYHRIWPRLSNYRSHFSLAKLSARRRRKLLDKFLALPHHHTINNNIFSNTRAKPSKRTFKRTTPHTHRQKSKKIRNNLKTKISTYSKLRTDVPTRWHRISWRRGPAYCAMHVFSTHTFFPHFPHFYFNNFFFSLSLFDDNAFKFTASRSANETSTQTQTTL